MLTNIVNIDFSDFTEGIPCFICIAAMPFFYSISEGIAMGVISYVILNLVAGRSKRKENERFDDRFSYFIYREIFFIIIQFISLEL